MNEPVIGAGVEEDQLSPLSVVIATLGGEVLRSTLDMLNSGGQQPAEILVCIPEREAASQNGFGHGNVRLVVIPCRGQVKQRAYGLALAQQPFVMQMDDDILIRPNSVQALLDALRHLGAGNVVSPLYRHKASNEYITHYSKGLKGWLSDLHASLLCAAPWGARRMGRLTPAGIGFWVDRELIGDEPFETEWLPGGCAICRKEDLILDDYYPFPGKAFSEDLIHSVFWRRKGARLWAVPTVDCHTDIEPMPFVWRQMKSDLRAHAYVARMTGGACWRPYVWFVFYLALQTVRITVRAMRPKGRVETPLPLDTR